MQIRRVEEGLAESEAARADANLRWGMRNDPPDDPLRRELDALPVFDPDRPIRVPTARLAMMVATDIEFLLVALNHVRVAAKRLPDDQKPALEAAEMIRLLRNRIEHFDEADGPSAEDLREKYPNVSVFGHLYTRKDIWLGGEGGVSVRSLERWLFEVREAMATRLGQLGVEAPGPDESVFEGDDALAWPPERLRFDWRVPQVEPDEWPRPPEDWALFWEARGGRPEPGPED